MKWIVLASALALGSGAAVAQDTPATTPQTTAAPAASAAAPAADATDPVGGYQPSAPPMASPPPPGAQVVFNPSPAPNVAFPPPPPLDKYPVCKKGQYDNCIQRGGK